MVNGFTNSKVKTILGKPLIQSSRRPNASLPALGAEIKSAQVESEVIYHD